jgi:hypothetical protein
LAAPENDWDVDPELASLGVGEITDRLDRAAILMRRDPLRQGNVVALPHAGELVVLGDIHGDLDNFRRVVEWAALYRNRDKYLVLQELIHGGPQDDRGGDLSYRLLEEAAALKIRYKSQVQMILSNHDLCEILGSNITKSGVNTSAVFWRGIENAYGSAWPEVHGAYRRFLAALPLAVRTPNGLFISHSTPQGDALESFDYSIFQRALAMEDYLPGGSVHALVWGRWHDQQAADRFAKAVEAEVLVTGHQTSMPGVKTPTSRHIVLVSDGPLGRVLSMRLSVQVPHHVLVRQVIKIRSLPAP